MLGFCRVIRDYLNPNRLCVWGVIYYAWLKIIGKEGTKMICKKCGSKIPEDAKECKKCGSPVMPETPAENGSDRKKWIYGGAAAGIVLVLLLAILISGKAGGDLLKTNGNNNASGGQTVSGESAQLDGQEKSPSGKSGKGKKNKDSDNKGADPKAAEAPKNVETPEPTEEVILNYTDEYVFPYSNMKYLKKSDVKDLSLSTISLGKDELFARYGRIFDNAEVQNHFDQCGWYTAIYTEAEWNEFGDDYFFNKYDKKNLAFLEKWEKKMKQKKDKQ